MNEESDKTNLAKTVKIDEPSHDEPSHEVPSEDSSKADKKSETLSVISVSTLWPLALLLATMVFGLNIWFGNLNQDEGWYLYAGQQMADGAVPYRDFAFTQGPVLPIVFSLCDSIIDQHGVLAGRLINTAFALGTAIWLLLLAQSLAPKRWKNASMLMAFSLCFVNVYQAYFLTVVKTYSIAAFFTMAGLYFLLRALRTKAITSAAFAGLLLSTAAATRLSAGLALPIGGLALLLAYKRLGIWNVVSFAAAGAVSLALWFLPYYLKAPDGFIFGLITYHTQRENSGDLMLKAGFISRIVQAYFVASVLAAGGLIASWRFAKSKWSRKEKAAIGEGVIVLWIILLAITLLHISSSFPYDDYQAFIYPLFAVLIASALSQLLVEFHKIKGLVCLLVLCACCASCFSSPINSDWFVIGRDRIWWLTKSDSDLSLLRKTAKEIKSLSGESKVLLTQDTYLAVEAGLKVPAGLEMGVFSYYPELSTEDAEKMHVLNKTKLLELIASTDAKIAAVSDYGFSVVSPEIKPIELEAQQEILEQLENRYKFEKRVEHFGQGHGPLNIYSLTE